MDTPIVRLQVERFVEIETVQFALHAACPPPAMRLSRTRHIRSVEALAKLLQGRRGALECARHAQRLDRRSANEARPELLEQALAPVHVGAVYATYARHS